MSAEILINVTARDIRIALVENNILQAIYIERADSLRLIGNIYKGRVVRVLPGMQAAFIDIGLERTAYLHEKDMYAQDQQNKQLKVDQELLVQVIKDPIDAKGAKVTTRLSIPTRTLAYVPSIMQDSVSVKILDPVEQSRLLNLLQGSDPNIQGFVVRTSAMGAKSLAADKKYLVSLWSKILEKSKLAKVGDVVFKEVNFILCTLRDFISNNIDLIRVDNIDAFADIQQYCMQAMPEFATTIELHNDPKPILELYNVNEQIKAALARKVPLKSGGYIVIDHTEAMTVIDVNTGAYVGDKNLEATAFNTNLEAVTVICRQMRLRNLGGIIIVDFIDMQDAKHKAQILAKLEQELQQDNIKTTINGFTTLGLVEITRKRVQQTLAHALCLPCSTCEGSGFVERKWSHYDNT